MLYVVSLVMADTESNHVRSQQIWVRLVLQFSIGSKKSPMPTLLRRLDEVIWEAMVERYGSWGWKW